MPISTFPRHDDYDEDEYLLKPGRLRDTRSEGKVNRANDPKARSFEKVFDETLRSFTVAL
jgi:hypothetical protein